MRVVVITPPTPIVTWEEAKAHLRLDGDSEKVLVEAMIAAATANIDGPTGWLGRSIGAQDLEVRFDLVATSSTIRLPYAPVISLLGVTYLDRNDVEQEADLDDFELLGDMLVPQGSEWIWLGGSLRREAGRVRYRAGYVDVPAPIKAAVLMMVGDMHRFRSTASDMNISPTAIPMSTTVDALLQPYRVYR
jgi:uncharacterized phiE125 gp8 family phage protein